MGYGNTGKTLWLMHGEWYGSDIILKINNNFIDIFKETEGASTFIMIETVTRIMIFKPDRFLC